MGVLTLADEARNLQRKIVDHSLNVLTIDIERLPGLAPVWEQRTKFIPASKWRRNPSLLCFAAKWYGDQRILFHAAWHKTDMVQAAWDLYNQADIVVTYNGISFDNPHLRTEWLLAGLPPPAPWKNVDLYRVNRSAFGFESRSLDHLCKRLGIQAKTGHYDPDVAEAAANGDKTAQAEIRAYNIGDVQATEGAYDRLRPWITNHPHLTTTDELRCNKCGSADLQRLPGDYRAVVMDYAQYRCQACGGLVRASFTRRAATTRGIQ